MKIALSLTHDCNLACKYCYAGTKFHRDMSLDTAKKIVDFSFKLTPPQHNLRFSFFGGEPLLRMDLMRDVVNYIRERQQAADKPISLSVTSNATLIDRDILDFMREECIELCISLDGPEHVHDRNRSYPDGHGSHEKVMRNLQQAIAVLPYVQVNAVYDPITLCELPETVNFFVQEGIPVIHLNPNVYADWPLDCFEQVLDAFMAVADSYVQSYERSQEVAVNLLDSKMVLFLKDGYAAEDRCGMGETQWAFAPSGNIYPCERFIGEDTDLTFCLGNIHTGLNLTRRCWLLRQRGNRNVECITCPMNSFCMNWCGCTNFFGTGHTDLAGPALCALERAAISTAQHTFIKLSDNALFLDHLMHYCTEGRHHLWKP